MNNIISTYGVHWFRRDLRVAGNSNLQRNWKDHNGRVLGFFCFDQMFLQREDFSSRRFQFFLGTLVELKRELQEAGGDLLVMDVGPDVAFQKLFDELKKQNVNLPRAISWSRDYEPFAVNRDKRMRDFFKSCDIIVLAGSDHLVVEPEDLLKSNGEPYQVYSPFARKWLEVFNSGKATDTIRRQKSGFEYFAKRQKNATPRIFNLIWSDVLPDQSALPDSLNHYYKNNARNVDIEIPKAGSFQAFQQLAEFKEKLFNYKDGRDQPAKLATSRLSIFLKNGSLTTAQIISYLNLEPYQTKQSSKDTFFSELIWREFYYHILFHYPRVENEAFLEKFKNLKWENDEHYFAAWMEGRTGFPIVDAGMRELNTTGWMHNRVRMIVASFLSKDLLVDWRWGEKYFMQKLLDGDLAPNNGGWQWAASTGCDPQPYFRIFNPWLQSAKFDPDGIYIKKYVPELSGIDVKKLHQPIEGCAKYPKPIVDHKLQREKALTIYKI